MQIYRSSAVSFPFHDNCPIPIYAAKCLYVVVVLCFSMFSCGSCWVWYDNRIIGDFRIFLCAICLICQLKNPTHHCSAQNPNIEWMDFSRNLLLRKKNPNLFSDKHFAIHFWNFLFNILLGHQNMTSKIMV